MDITINKKMTTKLLSAIQKDNIDHAKALIENGADVNVKNAEGLTPLMLAE